MNKNTTLGLILIAIVIIAVGGYSFPRVKTVVTDSLGSVGTRFPNGLAVGTIATVTQNKMTIGNSGTAIGNLLFGTCNLLGADASQAASSTKEYVCNVTGATSGDVVIAQLATTTAPAITGFGGLYIVGARASTSNQIGIGIYNGTGATVTLSNAGVNSGIGSSTRYIIIR